ncbi:MAG: hypothetical protein HOA15_02615 [Candidatus Marinimicrobia bacterium]|jgi:hypothetical protein|nr:hypothetical protein [Candidatus Neomarinimicrobiota bacterium]MBT3675094.1 hypothetical protein [Candidatus Neomarinimicrobiota bacterium]MBT3763554.1 hypothetical protein [Candidatus Neomarinimicrobiota bacterium]MBT4067557.1 hypothetical protein [Candidatus Neomarinimicrobiota bacterium]MBT4270378.1 hypothetical protein [Candidatus Neomarinimicrobiota bacterium]
MKITLSIIIASACLFGQILEKQNKLLWDGTDWANVSARVDGNPEMSSRIKSAYLSGILDGRLYFYLKAWSEEQTFADSLYGDRIDYLTRRETIRQLDRFYKDPLMVYVPVVSAMIIVHMQAEQVPKKVVDRYVEQTKYWINQITLDMQSRGMHELLKEKQEKHSNKKY